MVSIDSTLYGPLHRGAGQPTPTPIAPVQNCLFLCTGSHSPTVLTNTYHITWTKHLSAFSWITLNWLASKFPTLTEFLRNADSLHKFSGHDRTKNVANTEKKLNLCPSIKGGCQWADCHWSHTCVAISYTVRHTPFIRWSCHRRTERRRLQIRVPLSLSKERWVSSRSWCDVVQPYLRSIVKETYKLKARIWLNV